MITLESVKKHHYASRSVYRHRLTVSGKGTFEFNECSVEGVSRKSLDAANSLLQGTGHILVDSYDGPGLVRLGTFDIPVGKEVK